VLLIVALAPLSGCSIRRMAINSLADSLASQGDVFASDEDPELVRGATPFALKTVEGLLVEVPDHEGLLLTACSGFTQYAYAFIESDAELIEDESYDEAQQLRERALRMYLRARDYCLRGLALEEPDILVRLAGEPDRAAADLDDVPFLYWTGASWGSAISLGKDRPELIADLSAVVALMRRALELDESYADGAIHEVMIVLESLPANMGGSRERAREHYDRALELSGGLRASPHVSLAENVAVPTQNRSEFVDLLGRALEVDPNEYPGWRLQNLIVQRRAHHLLGRVDDLFLDPEEEGETP
jgi:predicted anti-sigma-YlaC factor YlaD